MQEYLRLLSEKKIIIDEIIHSVHPIKHIEQAFDLLQSKDKPLIVLLDCSEKQTSIILINIYMMTRK